MHLKLSRMLPFAGWLALAPLSCARVVTAGTDGTPPGGTDAFTPPGTDAVAPPGTDAFTPSGTDAALPGWTPPPSDGLPCAPEACPADAPQCVGPDPSNAYCRATCNPITVPDPCAPAYACVDLTMGGGACLPAGADEGCCNVCGCQAGLTCVSLGAPNGNVCLTNCTPPDTSPCDAGESCVMLMGGGGACLNQLVYPSCSGNTAMEQMCI
ncbi:MAG TPA: hypothetical protein VG389_23205 [Myxococcota bacterium]|nr:hypothetical protein [Myxococcota bacterium]